MFAVPFADLQLVPAYAAGMSRWVEGTREITQPALTI